MIDYGARIRAVCDHLETVPGERYTFIWPILYDGCGCVIAHAKDAGIIDISKDYREAQIWLGFDWDASIGDKMVHFLGTGGSSSGEKSKQIAIKSLRAHADEHYPITAQQVDFIPASVRQIFAEPALS